MILNPCIDRFTRTNMLHQSHGDEAAGSCSNIGSVFKRMVHENSGMTHSLSETKSPVASMKRSCSRNSEIISIQASIEVAHVLLRMTTSSERSSHPMGPAGDTKQSQTKATHCRSDRASVSAAQRIPSARHPRHGVCQEPKMVPKGPATPADGTRQPACFPPVPLQYRNQRHSAKCRATRGHLS